MARDIKKTIGDEQSVKEKLLHILQLETSKALDSSLINQILETHPTLKYEEVYNALNLFIHELSQ